MPRIFEVESATLSVLESQPRLLLVSALGRVVSAGWEQPQLIAHGRHRLSDDGILDFDFVAKPPTGPTREALYPIVAHATWSGDIDRLQGVRIHAARNSVEEPMTHATPCPAVEGSQTNRAASAEPLASGLRLSGTDSGDASQTQPLGVLLGGLLREDLTFGDEGTGLLLCESVIEVDGSKVHDPEMFDGREVVVEGHFELKRYPQRGGVWTFMARQIRAPRPA